MSTRLKKGYIALAKPTIKFVKMYQCDFMVRDVFAFFIIVLAEVRPYTGINGMREARPARLIDKSMSLSTSKEFSLYPWYIHGVV